METEPSTIRPAPLMTRDEFIDKARQLLEDMESDHEDHTGVSDSDLRDWEFWSSELSNAYLNS